MAEPSAERRSFFALVAAPCLLALLPALSLWPARDSMPGWPGGDSLFNLWTFELVWHRLATLGPLRIFAADFWRAPLYGGAPLGLAFSENQLFPALLLWPVRLASGNGAFALGVGAVASILLAHLCAALWLRTAGVTRLHWWGGLVFAGCGWLQSQYAHYQNLCVFVLPLALLAWARFRARPGFFRLLCCASAFGWIAGWNLYFQVFANAILAVLAGRALWTRALPRLRTLLLLLLTAAVQSPIALKYLALSRTLGGLRALETYGATARSLFGSAARPRALLPSFEVPIEAAGFVGLAWLVLMAVSLRRRASRPWILASAIAFWAALGAGYGFFDAVAWLPGLGGLRATGRAQVLVILLSLPAVLGLLEAFRPGRAAAALAAVLAELLPASLPQRAPVAPALWGPRSPLSQQLARSNDPVLVLPRADERFMLYASQTFTPFFGGYSGRAPPGEELLEAIAVRRPWGPGSLEAALALTRPRRVLALTKELSAELGRSPRLRSIGCFQDADGVEGCLFQALDDAPAATLRLDRDARFEARSGTRWPEVELRATSAGSLEILAVDRCRLRQTLQFPHLPPLKHDVPLQGSALLGATFSAGETILSRRSALGLFRLPAAIRPVTSFEVICEP